MMNNARLLASAILLFALLGCEDKKLPFATQEATTSSTGPPANALADGLLALSGKDTDFLGDTIRAGDVAFRYHAPGASAYCYVFVDELTAILADDYIDPDAVDADQLLVGDPDNTFILRVIDDLDTNTLGIFLTITKDGVEASYACNPMGTPNKDCRQISVDRTSRVLTLNSVLMEPTSGASIRKLQIDGQLTWTAGGE